MLCTFQENVHNINEQHPWQPLIKIPLKCSYNSILGGVYFMQKCQIPKFRFDLLWTDTFRGNLAAQGNLGSKNNHQQKCLNLILSEGIGPPPPPWVASDQKVT
jgi:hypothetical protein